MPCGSQAAKSACADGPAKVAADLAAGVITPAEASAAFADAAKACADSGKKIAEACAGPWAPPKEHPEPEPMPLPAAWMRADGADSASEEMELLQGSTLFDSCAAALAKIGAGRDAHAKLRALVFCLEALGDSDEGPLVTADVLLPRAVACVAEAKVPHLRAELAYVDAFARDDVLLGAEGYALTTLSCALDVLADGDDSGEQPVLDLGGESWPAPPAPPPASPLGGEEWPEPL